MPHFDISLDSERRLVIIKAFGELREKDGEKIITAARTKAMENDYNIIYDLRNATTTVLFASWYHLPRKLEVFNTQKAFRIKAAVLVSPTDKSMPDYKFYETVTENLGLKLRVFLDESEAHEWLSTSKSFH